jgi:hypothetical protein
MDEVIVQKNYRKMIGSEEGEMQRLLVEESFGGNAGFHNGKSCAAANFYYNPKTGEINIFGNFQDVPENIKKKSLDGTFVLTESHGHPVGKIIKLDAQSNLQSEAYSNLLVSAGTYNLSPPGVLRIDPNLFPAFPVRE